MKRRLDHFPSLSRTVALAIVLASSCSSTSTTQWTDASPQLTALIRAQEVQVWEALKNKDKTADRKFLDDHFVGVYRDGFGTAAEHVAQIDDVYQLTGYQLDNVRVFNVSAAAVMIVYRATCQATGTWVADCAQPLYISSLWIRHGERWVNVFSQDTSAVKK